MVGLGQCAWPFELAFACMQPWEVIFDMATCMHLISLWPVELGRVFLFFACTGYCEY